MRLNPIQAIQLIKSGRNPNEIINQLASNNPQFMNVLNGMKDKSIEEKKQYVENLAKERGINLNEFMNKMGF